MEYLTNFLGEFPRSSYWENSPMAFTGPESDDSQLRSMERSLKSLNLTKEELISLGATIKMSCTLEEDLNFCISLIAQPLVTDPDALNTFLQELKRLYNRLGSSIRTEKKKAIDRFIEIYSPAISGLGQARYFSESLVTPMPISTSSLSNTPRRRVSFQGRANAGGSGGGGSGGGGEGNSEGVRSVATASRNVRPGTPTIMATATATMPSRTFGENGRSAISIQQQNFQTIAPNIGFAGTSGIVATNIANRRNAISSTLRELRLPVYALRTLANQVGVEDLSGNSQKLINSIADMASQSPERMSDFLDQLQNLVLSTGPIPSTIIDQLRGSIATTGSMTKNPSTSFLFSCIETPRPLASASSRLETMRSQTQPKGLAFSSTRNIDSEKIVSQIQELDPLNLKALLILTGDQFQLPIVSYNKSEAIRTLANAISLDETRKRYDFFVDTFNNVKNASESKLMDILIREPRYGDSLATNTSRDMLTVNDIETQLRTLFPEQLNILHGLMRGTALPPRDRPIIQREAQQLLNRIRSPQTGEGELKKFKDALRQARAYLSPLQQSSRS